MFFVLTLESGRVKVDDLVTIKLVLDAVGESICDNQYSILVNKVTPEVEELLYYDPKALNVPPSFGATTNSVFLIPINPILTDQDNKLDELSPELLDFIENAPEIIINKGSLQDIQDAQYEDFLRVMRRDWAVARR